MSSLASTARTLTASQPMEIQEEIATVCTVASLLVSGY